MPDKNKKKARKILEKYQNINFVERTSKTFNPKSPDASYDVLLRMYPDTKHFLFNHDDSIYKSNTAQYLDNISQNYDFFGAIDNASKPGLENPYSSIEIDGIPFIDLRLGTWFLGGLTSEMIDSNYYVGRGQKEYPMLINIKYKTLRLKVKKLRVNTDGGFNFNISSRLDNKKINIVDPFNDGIAEHFTRLSAGFANRGLIDLIDHPDEFKIWMKRLKAFKDENNQNQFTKDKAFLLGIANKFKEYSIQDELFNDDLIEFLNEN